MIIYINIEYLFFQEIMAPIIIQESEPQYIGYEKLFTIVRDFSKIPITRNHFQRLYNKSSNTKRQYAIMCMNEIVSKILKKRNDIMDEILNGINRIKRKFRLPYIDVYEFISIINLLIQENETNFAIFLHSDLSKDQVHNYIGRLLSSAIIFLFLASKLPNNDNCIIKNAIFKIYHFSLYCTSYEDERYPDICFSDKNDGYEYYTMYVGKVKIEPDPFVDTVRLLVTDIRGALQRTLVTDKIIIMHESSVMKDLLYLNQKSCSETNRRRCRHNPCNNKIYDENYEFWSYIRVSTKEHVTSNQPINSVRIYQNAYVLAGCHSSSFSDNLIQLNAFEEIRVKKSDEFLKRIDLKIPYTMLRSFSLFCLKSFGYTKDFDKNAVEMCKRFEDLNVK